jgi:regulator of protease activity HflC (stomatin/prohibitin superfamily)
LVVSIFDHIVAIIHERIQTTAFNAEQALTKDTVPVNVDAIIFWHVADAKKRVALAITDQLRRGDSRHDSSSVR